MTLAILAATLTIAPQAFAHPPSADDTPPANRTDTCAGGDSGPVICWTPGAVPERTARDAVVSNLNRGLRGTPMQGTGRQLERIARRWNISPYFVIGVSAKESSLGHHACRSNPRNIWGLASCRTGPYIDVDGDGDVDSLPVFRTWGHAYTWFVRYIVRRQPHARTPYELRGYCECNERQWADVVAGTMRRLFGVAPNVRYAQ